MRRHLRRLLFFFFNDTATTEIYTLSLHDALPISVGKVKLDSPRGGSANRAAPTLEDGLAARLQDIPPGPEVARRSEEHTSELQSHLNLVCRLLLEKKKRTPVVSPLRPHATVGW